MAPFLLLLVLLAEAASDLIEVTPGDDVILPCRADDSSIRALEWSRPDLEPDAVLFYRDGHLETEEQNPSFKDRVELVDRELKDGDVSLTLKNVNINDTGTYECGVIADGSGSRKRNIRSNLIRIIRTVHLQVTDLNKVTVHPGDDVILPCRANGSSIRAVKWTRPGLDSDIFLLDRDGHFETDDQHPSYKDRVDLVDRDLKDGDVSLTLKNVNINDTGTYECRVASGGSRRKKRNIIDSEPIRIVRLQVTELKEVTPGDNVTLECWFNDSSISTVKWSRVKLESETVLLNSNGKLKPDQHESFKDRVELVHGDLKGGNVSLILKNVNINDTGTYKCEVKTGATQKIRTIRTIRLQVQGEKISSLKDEKPANDVPKDGPSSPGLGVGAAVFLVLGAAVAVAGVLMYKRRQRPGLPGAAADKQPAESTPLEK